ncbi:Uncharacterised protein [Achromobacter kerstersii]|nr:Uncharacterised protein [Achromobacter kerstersii]
MAYCINSGACGLMNCGRNADINNSALGLVSATRKLRMPSANPTGRASAAEADDGKTSAESDRSIFQPR